MTQQRPSRAIKQFAFVVAFLLSMTAAYGIASLFAWLLNKIIAVSY